MSLYDTCWLVLGMLQYWVVTQKLHEMSEWRTVHKPVQGTEIADVRLQGEGSLMVDQACRVQRCGA
jgi:hypothetical protein